MSEASQFFPEERQLWDLYARYAASALDGATALADAERRHNEARALLELARALAAAGTSDEVAVRLAEAVPAVVDCDRVGVFLWTRGGGGARPCGHMGRGRGGGWRLDGLRIRPSDTPLLARPHRGPRTHPDLLAQDSGDRFVRRILQRFALAIADRGTDRGSRPPAGHAHVSVHSRRERLDPRQDLLDRLSGVAAHAASALENGRLIDRVTHQARHDGLTGLANRAFFAERIESAPPTRGPAMRRSACFFVDLDGFKAVNDERGHAVGDELLCQVASRLLDTVRSTDTVARLGGDEFAIVLPGRREHGRDRGRRRARGGGVRRSRSRWAARRCGGREHRPRDLARGRGRGGGAHAPRGCVDVSRQARWRALGPLAVDRCLAVRARQGSQIERLLERLLVHALLAAPPRGSSSLRPRTPSRSRWPCRSRCTR